MPIGKSIGQRRPLIGRRPAALAILVTLALAGCGRTPHATARPSPTATQVTRLAWRQVALPAGGDLQHDGFAISPVDGRDAWVCAPASVNTFTMWTTQDAGTSWRQLATLSPATPEPVRWCTLVADEGDPRSVVAGFNWGSGEAGTLRSISYVSTDGGTQWRPLPGEVQTIEIGSVGGKTFAILNDTSAGPSAQPPPELVVSTDGLRSWHANRPAGLDSRDGFFRFWVSPATGELLAATYDNTLWLSDNAGGSWSHVSTPDMQIGFAAWLSQPGHWLMCGGTSAQPSQLLCSTDLGETWRPQPTFDYTLHCDTCGKRGAPYTLTQSCGADAITSDGSLVAVCPVSGDAAQPTFAAYRLAPSTSTWTSLGAAPSPFLTLSATGQIWCVDAQHGAVAVATLPS